MLHSTFTCHGTTVRSHWQRSGTSARMCTKTGGIKNKNERQSEREREREKVIICWHDVCVCQCDSRILFLSEEEENDAAAEKPSEGRGRIRTSACLQVSVTAAKHKTETHLSDIRSYLTSLRIMAPFRGCHRVQCCVMRLFTLKKESTKKSDKHVFKK